VLDYSQVREARTSLFNAIAGCFACIFMILELVCYCECMEWLVLSLVCENTTAAGTDSGGD